MTSLRTDPPPAASDLPLSGIRIVDLSWVLAGPIATTIMATLGADVVKVESRSRLDQTRGGAQEERPDSYDFARGFNTVNHTKRSITVDLKTARGIDIVSSLCAEADVLVENFGFGALDRMGLYSEQLRAENPRLIHISSSGFGRTGPLKMFRAYGNNIHAYSGLTDSIRYSDDVPLGIHGVFSDPVGAYTLALATLRALHEREATGRGQLVDLSMVESTVFTVAYQALLAQAGEQHPNDQTGTASFLRGAFHTRGKDDTWIVLTVPTRGHADGVLSIVGGRPESEVRSLADADADAALVDLVRDWLGGLTLEDGVAACTRLGLPHSISRTPARLFNDPHLNERGFYVEVTHPRTGTRRVQRPAWIRSGGFRIDRAPLLGEHTEEVLQTWLAMSSEQTADLNAQGVLR